MEKTGCTRLAGGTSAQDTVTVGYMMAQAQAVLAGALGLASSEARIEMQALLRRALGDVSRTWLIAHEHDPVAPEQQAAFELLRARRLAGEPIAYILGEREFFGLMFKVTPDTLIPRPETELLVELALQRIPNKQRSSPTPLSPACVVGASIPFGHGVPLAGAKGEGGRNAGRGNRFRVLDLGTGCGAIALSIAQARPDTEVVAVDTSTTALEVARENAQRLGIANADFVQSSWFASLGGQHFDLIVSNPPYVAVGDPHLQQGDVRFEPPSALVSGGDGLHDIRCIVSLAKTYLACGGWLLLEHGYNQAVQVREMLRQSGFDEVFSAPDLAGIERASGGRF